MAEPSCACGGGTLTLIFACSGAANVGKMADEAARKLTREGKGKMYCLAGLGGDVKNIIETTRSADRILVIDGCPVDCAKKTLDRVGIKKYDFVRVTDLGLEKGKTPVTEEAIAKAAAAGEKALSC
jgi:uncharacterized metal-binding protein